MRNLKAKFMRKCAKGLSGDNWKSYEPTRQPTFQKVGNQFIKTSKGVPLKLSPDCGRSIYQKTKRAL